MHNIYLKDLIKICNAKLISGDEDTVLESFSIDTRKLNKNDIYVGIKGVSIDGSNFYVDALNKGTLGCILNDTVDIDKEIIKKYPDKFIVLVKDTIKCLQDLAKYKRSLYDIPVIGVTGSVGKTSTKDMITSVLSQKYKVLSTIGNYNNHIGVPLTILRLKDEECAVIEMGMNNLGEISLLSNISKPTVAVITNVGTAHIGNLGSRENILKAKLEILDGMDSNGVLVINNDNDLLHKYYLENGYDKNIVTFGTINSSNYMANNIISNKDYSVFSSNIDDCSYDFKVNVPGSAFILNGLCAIAVGRLFDIDVSKLKLGIENFSLTKKRMEVELINNITIINDSYNANLDSMNNAINYLGSLNGRKIAVLGDMLELGDYSESLHRSIAHTILNNKIDIVITVGKNSKYIKDELNKNNYDNVYSYDNNNEALNKLEKVVSTNDNVLFKASNSLHFYDLCNSFKENIS